MALVVEDGTGKSDAESYASVSEAKTYADARGLSISGKSDLDIEAALRQATVYIESRWRFKAQRASAAQALEFPRTGLVDWSGYTVTGLPARVRQATLSLALKALSGESLYEDQARGGRITSESVAGISVSYESGAPTGKVYAEAENLLKPFVRDPGTVYPPSFGGSDTGYFSLGMHDSSVGSGIVE